MATPETRSNTQQGKPPDAPPAVLPSAIAAEVSAIVMRLETLPESAQRRILEGSRVALGLMPLPPKPAGK